MKILLLIFCATTLLLSDLITDFDNGKYNSGVDTYYALGIANKDKVDYRNLALLQARHTLASQLITYVSSTQNYSMSVHKKNDTEQISSFYKESTHISTKNLPILGVEIVKRELKNSHFYILIKFDFKKVSNTYKLQTEYFVENINKYYKNYTNARQITLKQKLLKKLKNLYENYEVYAQMCSLLGVTHKIPNVSMARIDKHLFNLYNQEATNISDLAKILVSRLSIKKITAPLEILPIGFEEKFQTTKFSHKLKHLLQNELYDKVEVTKAVFTPFKMLGTYTLQKDILQVHVIIVNEDAQVIDSALAMMRVQDKTLFLQHSQQQAAPSEPYSIMEDYFENW